MDGEKETIIMGAAEVICCFFLEEKIYTTDQKLVNTSTHAYLRDSPDKSAWVRGRRGVPAVAADLSFHLYMHKKTNKRQHT